MILTERQKQILSGKICPYCGNQTKLIDSKEIYGTSYGMAYICYCCDAYVGCHKGTDKSKGRVANKELRIAKCGAHEQFDKIWQNKLMSRKNAYKWLSEQLNIPAEYTHIGMFSIDTCRIVEKISKQFLEKIK